MKSSIPVLGVHRFAQQIEQAGERVDRDRAPRVERRFGDEHRQRGLARAHVALDPQPSAAVEVLHRSRVRSGEPTGSDRGRSWRCRSPGDDRRRRLSIGAGMRPARLLGSRPGDAPGPAAAVRGRVRRLVDDEARCRRTWPRRAGPSPPLGAAPASCRARQLAHRTERRGSATSTASGSLARTLSRRSS